MGQPLPFPQVVAAGDDVHGLLQVGRFLPVDFRHVGGFHAVALGQLEGLAGLHALQLERIAQVHHLGPGLLGHVVELGLLALRQEGRFIHDPEFGLALEIGRVLLGKLDVLL